jgi:hypothetical protein
MRYEKAMYKSRTANYLTCSLLTNDDLNVTVSDSSVRSCAIYRAKSACRAGLQRDKSRSYAQGNIPSWPYNN